jgi:hypothetical protein
MSKKSKASFFIINNLNGKIFYIMNKKIKPAEKIGKCIILLVFLLAFNLNIPNFIYIDRRGEGQC